MEVPPAERDWTQVLGPYRKPSLQRSVREIAITLVPFLVLCALSFAALQVSFLLSLVVSAAAAVFLVRLFLIQHDCGHGAFFKKKKTNDWVGRALGVLTLTPYDVWRRAHAVHHATSGNLDERGMGDILTLTVREYEARSPLGKFAYRLYRNPIVMFGFGPAYVFFLQNRLPFGLMKSGSVYWLSAMGTNLAIALTAVLLAWAVGVQSFLAVYIPVVVIAATIGIWLFYVQHQFEDTFWAESDEWNLKDAALYGSSYYDLPGPLRWFTANIGMHHVHHFCSRIPFYRLPEVMADFPELSNMRRLTLRESLDCLKLRLWDEDSQRLISFKEAQQLQLARS